MDNLFLAVNYIVKLVLLKPLDRDHLHPGGGEEAPILKQFDLDDLVRRVEHLSPQLAMDILQHVVADVVEEHADEAERHRIGAELADELVDRGDEM